MTKQCIAEGLQCKWLHCSPHDGNCIPTPSRCVRRLKVKTHDGALGCRVLTEIIRLASVELQALTWKEDRIAIQVWWRQEQRRQQRWQGEGEKFRSRFRANTQPQITSLRMMVGRIIIICILSHTINVCVHFRDSDVCSCRTFSTNITFVPSAESVYF